MTSPLEPDPPDRTDPSEEEDAALRALPTGHAVAIRLLRAGAGREQIATALGVDPDAVDGIVEVAKRKLAQAVAEMRQRGPDGGRSARP